VHVDRNQLFPFFTDIRKYALTQATNWCALFVVKVCWRYIRVSFLDTLKCQIKFEEGHKEEKAIPLPLPCRSLPLYNWSECVDFSICPQKACSVTCVAAL